MSTYGKRTAGCAAHEALVVELQRGMTLPTLLPHVNRVLKPLLGVFNEQYAARYLVRLSTEVVPTHPRYVSAVRARMGSLIELYLAAIWNRFIERGNHPGWRLSVNYVTEYPNLYLRDAGGEVHLRIETKALHDEADEGAARFEVRTPLIDPSLDVLIVVGWKWRGDLVGNKTLVSPTIMRGEAFSAIEIATERDTRFRTLGGSFRSGGIPYVRSMKSGKWVPDPGNYGKLNRIVHSSRLERDLSAQIRAFQQLLRDIYPERYAGREKHRRGEER